MAITSETRPAEIKILDIRDDLKRGKTEVLYAFRFNITKTTQDVIDAETGTTSTTTVYTYEEYTSTLQVDMFLRDQIPGILEALYNQLVPVLIERYAATSAEIPTEITLDTTTTTG